MSIDSSVTVYDNSSSVELCSTLSDNVSFDGVNLTLSVSSTEGNATPGIVLVQCTLAIVYQ